MKITSRAFSEGEDIPPKYTCDGENINPKLLISDVPEGAKSLAFIMDDPDVPKAIHPEGIWTHWVMWNIPVETKIIAENSAPKNAIVGENSRGNNKYAGPCPPDREHRYFFKLYALDTTLDLPVTTNKEGLLRATEGHVIGSAELIGLYERI